MEKPTGGKIPGTRRGTIPWSPTEVNILYIYDMHPGTIMEGYHSMLNNPGEHSAASYFKDTLDTSPSLHLATSAAEYRDRLGVHQLFMAMQCMVLPFCIVTLQVS